MNKDLISREALKNDLKQYFSDGVLDGVSAKLAFNMILRKIDNAPTVEAKEVYMTAKDYNLYLAGYKQGKKDFAPTVEITEEQTMTNNETAIALLSEFREKHTFYGKDHERDMNDTFDLAIKALEERPQGEWIIIDDTEQFIAKCSICGRIEDSRMIKDYPFCHCGADMRCGENDG